MTKFIPRIGWRLKIFNGMKVARGPTVPPREFLDGLGFVDADGVFYTDAIDRYLVANPASMVE